MPDEWYVGFRPAHAERAVHAARAGIGRSAEEVQPARRASIDRGSPFVLWAQHAGRTCPPASSGCCSARAARPGCSSTTSWSCENPFPFGQNRRPQRLAPGRKQDFAPHSPAAAGRSREGRRNRAGRRPAHAAAGGVRRRQEAAARSWAKPASRSPPPAATISGCWASVGQDLSCRPSRVPLLACPAVSRAAAAGKLPALTDAGWLAWERAPPRRARLDQPGPPPRSEHGICQILATPPRLGARTCVTAGWQPAPRQHRRLHQRRLAPKSLRCTADDHAFVRRIYLDTSASRPPPSRFARSSPTRSPTSAASLIDHLLDQPGWADNWVGYWQDVLAENPNIVNPTLNNTGPFRWWIYEALLDNKPLDRFATELILMEGTPRYGGTAGFAIATENDAPLAAKAQNLGLAFLGFDMRCARCHDAPQHRLHAGRPVQPGRHAPPRRADAAQNQHDPRRRTVARVAARASHAQARPENRPALAVRRRVRRQAPHAVSGRPGRRARGTGPLDHLAAKPAVRPGHGQSPLAPLSGPRHCRAGR